MAPSCASRRGSRCAALRAGSTWNPSLGLDCVGDHGSWLARDLVTKTPPHGWAGVEWDQQSFSRFLISVIRSGPPQPAQNPSFVKVEKPFHCLPKAIALPRDQLHAFVGACVASHARCVVVLLRAMLGLQGMPACMLSRVMGSAVCKYAWIPCAGSWPIEWPVPSACRTSGLPTG